jgi:hypothetical protein
MAKPTKKEINERVKKIRSEQDLVIEVRRESIDGHVYSQIRDRSRDRYRGEPGEPPTCVVIDRQKGRGLDAETVERRAEALAELTGLPFDLDLAWPCAAEKGWPCRCPKCVDTTLRRRS